MDPQLRDELLGVGSALRRIERALGELQRGQSKLCSSLLPGNGEIQSSSELPTSSRHYESGQSVRTMRSGKSHTLEGFDELMDLGSGTQPLIGRQDTASGLGGLDMSHGKVSGFVASMLPPHWPKKVQLREWLRHSGVISERFSAQQGRLAMSKAATRALIMLRDSDDKGNERSMILHPDSIGYVMMEYLASAFVVYELCVTPFAIAWDVKMEGWLEGMFWCSAVFWLMDLILGFFMGYYLEGEVVRSQAMVRWHYFKGWFLVDLSLVACDVGNAIAMMLGMEGGNMLRLLRLSRLCRAVSLAKLSRLFLRLEDVMQSRENAERLTVGAKLARIVIIILSVNHLLACIWMLLARVADTDTGRRWVDTVLWEEAGVAVTYEDVPQVYQYTLSFRWALAQLTLGSHPIAAYNTWEELYMIVCVTLGLLIGTSLISLFSAEMVEVQLSSRQKDNVHKQLRVFLKHHRIEAGLSRKVRAMIFERLRKTPPVAEHEIGSLRSLPVYVQMELHFNICGPSLLTCPLFAVWNCFSTNTVVRFCMDAVHLQSNRPNDELFSGGSNADKTFYLKTGHGIYEQEPESAPVSMATEVRAGSNGKWLAEAALWVEWIHVGTMKLAAASEVLVIACQQIGHIIQQNVILQEITVAYCTVYHQRLITSGKPHKDWPSDLEVPDTDFEEILFNMDKMHIDAIADQTRERFKAVTGNSYELHANRINRRAMPMEVYDEKTLLLYPSTSDSFKCVAVSVSLRLTNAQGMILFHVCDIDSSGSVTMKACLPYTMQERGESPSLAVRRLMAERLSPIQSSLEAGAWQRTTCTDTESRTGSVKRGRPLSMRVLRSAFSVDIPEELENLTSYMVEPMLEPKESSNRLDASVKKTWSAALWWQSSITGAETPYGSDRHNGVGNLVEGPMYVFDHNKQDAYGVYMFISEDELATLSSPVGKIELNRYLACLSLDEVKAAARGDAVQQGGLRPMTSGVRDLNPGEYPSPGQALAVLRGSAMSRSPSSPGSPTPRQVHISTAHETFSASTSTVSSVAQAQQSFRRMIEVPL